MEYIFIIYNVLALLKVLIVLMFLCCDILDISSVTPPPHMELALLSYSRKVGLILLRFDQSNKGQSRSEILSFIGNFTILPYCIVCETPRRKIPNHNFFLSQESWKLDDQ